MTREQQQARRRRIVALYKAGDSLRQVASKVGLCAEYVRTILLSEGVPLRAMHLHHGAPRQNNNQYTYAAPRPRVLMPKDPGLFDTRDRTKRPRLSWDKQAALYAGRRYDEVRFA